MIPLVRGPEISQSPRGRKSTRGYQGLEKGGGDRISIWGNEKFWKYIGMVIAQ